MRRCSVCVDSLPSVPSQARPEPLSRNPVSHDCIVHALAGARSARRATRTRRATSCSPSSSPSSVRPGSLGSLLVCFWSRTALIARLRFLRAARRSAPLAPSSLLRRKPRLPACLSGFCGLCCGRCAGTAPHVAVDHRPAQNVSLITAAPPGSMRQLPSAVLCQLCRPVL